MFKSLMYFGGLFTRTHTLKVMSPTGFLVAFF